MTDKKNGDLGWLDEWQEMSEKVFSQLDDALARAATAKAPEGPDASSAEREDLERELKESRQTVVNLMLRLAQERRHWKASMLVVRRRMKGLRPKLSKTTDRMKNLESELSETQETTAKLLVELTRRTRGAEAEKKRGTRVRAAAAKSAPAAGKNEFSPGPAVKAAAARMNQSLRVLVESPALNPEVVSSIAAENLRLARALRLIAALSRPPRPHFEPGLLFHERVDRQLDLWEPELRRRGLTLLRMSGSELPQAAVDIEGFEAVLDEMVGFAAEQAPSGTTVTFKIAAAKDGGIALEFVDKGRPTSDALSVEDVVAKGDALPELGLALVRELVLRWGAAYKLSADFEGRGRRLAIILRPAAP